MKAHLLLAILAIAGCSRSLPNGSHESLFDATLWRSPQGQEPDKTARITPRQKMLGDLVDKHLVGKKRAEVIEMLGEPSTKMDPDGTGPSLSYPTGLERGASFRIDSEWLLIFFDSSGKVIRYKIGTD